MKKSIQVLSFFIFTILFLFCGFGTIEYADAQKHDATINNPVVTAKSAILVDGTSGTVIFEKEADRKLPIASMTKLVGLAVVFESIESGKIGLDQMVTISSNAASMDGSEAFLEPNKRYLVEDLIKSSSGKVYKLNKFIGTFYKKFFIFI